MKNIHTGHKRPRNRKIKLYISYLNLLINIFVITTLFVNINGTESDEVCLLIFILIYSN